LNVKLHIKIDERGVVGLVWCGCGCVWVRVSAGGFACMGVLCARTSTNGTSQFERKSCKFSRGNLMKNLPNMGEQNRKFR